MNINLKRLGEIFLELIKNDAQKSRFLEPLVTQINEMRTKDIPDETIRENIKAQAETFLEKVMGEFNKEQPAIENDAHAHFISKAIALQKAGATDEEIREIFTLDGTSLIEEAFAAVDRL